MVTRARRVVMVTLSTVWLLRDGALELRDDSGALQVGLVAGAPAGSPEPA